MELQDDLDLAAAVADSSVAFERWSRSLFETDAPSYPAAARSEPATKPWTASP